MPFSFQNSSKCFKAMYKENFIFKLYPDLGYNKCCENVIYKKELE